MTSIDPQQQMRATLHAMADPVTASPDLFDRVVVVATRRRRVHVATWTASADRRSACCNHRKSALPSTLTVNRTVCVAPTG